MITQKTYNFTLILSGLEQPTKAVENALFESNCGDALLYFRDRIGYLEFDREASNLEDAILSAILDVEKSGINVKPVRIEPSDIVTSAEISRRLDRSRESISQLISGKRGNGDFPLPVAGVTTNTMMWSWAEVSNWFYNHNKIDNYEIVEQAITIRHFNEALELHNQLLSLESIKSILSKLQNFKNTTASV
jgi:hypothetical protein